MLLGRVIGVILHGVSWRAGYCGVAFGMGLRVGYSAWGGEGSCGLWGRHRRERVGGGEGGEGVVNQAGWPATCACSTPPVQLTDAPRCPPPPAPTSKLGMSLVASSASSGIRLAMRPHSKGLSPNVSM